MCRGAYDPSKKGSRPLTHTPPSEAERAFRLLCDAGALLSATADPEAALASLARLVVGSVADVCLVDLVTRDGPVVRLAAAHRDPALGAQAWELRRHPPDPDDPADAIAGVLRTGRALLVREVEERWLRASVADREHREILRSMGVRSLLSAPVAAQGRVHGTLTLLCLDPPHRYGDDDLALVEELARRAALVVDHARLSEEAQQATQTAIQFLGAMTHELRTPVHIVSMFAELLLLGVPEPVPAGARKHAEHIRAAARHLDELVTQVLTFSRLQSDREGTNRETVDLVALARDTAALIEPLARQKELGFRVDLPADGIVASTDPNKLRQILFNLLGNAVKFTETGEVRLAVRSRSRLAVLEVWDTGIGIAPEHQERVFEPFWQVERELIPGAKGTGLGLGIVKRLVRLLHGSIEVESTPGAGSVFRVTLPLDHGHD